MDENEYQLDQPNVSVGPPAPLPMFGPSDALDMQRLMASGSGVRRQVQNGEITQEEGDDLLRQINTRLGPLQAGQQAAQQQQQQSATHQALGQAAMEDARMFAQQQHAAKNFTGGVASVTDPESGKTVMYAQVKPGHFEPVDFGDQAADASTERPAEEPAGEPQITVEPPTEPGGPFRQTIMNGARREVYEFPANGGPAKLVTRDMVSGGPWPEDQQRQQAGGQEYLSDHERIVNRQKAEQQYSNVPDSRHKRELVAAAQTHYNSLTARQNRDTAQNAAMSGREQTREQARKDRDAAKQDADLTAKQLSDLHTKRYKELSDELNRVRKHNATASTDEKEPVPDWGKDEDSMDAEAWRRAERAHKKAYPHRQGDTAAAGMSDTTKKATTAEERPSAPKVKPLPPEKATSADIEAEIERRKAARAGEQLRQQQMATGQEAQARQFEVPGNF